MLTSLLYTAPVDTELSGASFPASHDPRSFQCAISGTWNPVDLTCALSIHRGNSACTHTMAGRMRWTPTGLVIVGTWARGADDDAMIAPATFGDFSCSEVPAPPHRHTAAHPAGLWMGVRVPGLSEHHHRTERYPCRTLPPHSTYRHHPGSLVWRRLRPERRLSRLQRHSDTCGGPVAR